MPASDNLKHIVNANLPPIAYILLQHWHTVGFGRHTGIHSCCWVLKPLDLQHIYWGISTNVLLWCWWLNTELSSLTTCIFCWSRHSCFCFDALSLWLVFILSQTVSLGRTLCWVVIFYLILLMETSLFLLSFPPPAPLFLPALALDPVSRSWRLVRELLVRCPPTMQHPSVNLMSAGSLGPWNHSRLQMHTKTRRAYSDWENNKFFVLKRNDGHSMTASQTHL